MEEEFDSAPTPFEPAQLDLVDAPVSSDLDQFVAKAEKIAQSHPAILIAIEKDQEAHGLKKKAIRLADQAYTASQTPTLANLEVQPSQTAAPTQLASGCPRMPALVVLVFLLLRGWLGGPKSQTFRILLRESITLRQFLQSQNTKVPGPSTVADNINLVSAHTQQLILRCELEWAKQQKLDAFDTVRIDSTASSANSKYPTDSGLMAAFAQRLMAFFGALAKLGLPDFRQRAEARKAAELALQIDFQAKKIGLMSGKQGMNQKRADGYRKIYTLVDRLTKKVHPLFQRAKAAVEAAQLRPSVRQRIDALSQQAAGDLSKLAVIRQYSAERILEDKTVGAERKILSVSDEAAAIIKKGGWEQILGYRPQLAFSGKGLILAHEVPLGNAADSGQLEAVLEAVMANTQTTPRVVTVDDGYANGGVRKRFLQKHSSLEHPVVFSIAGAKGRAIIDEETYRSQAYRDARHDRSAAESCVFTLKTIHDYGEVMRRGLEAVRHEQMCKVLAYNIRRMVRLEDDARKARKKKLLLHTKQGQAIPQAA